MVGPFRMRGIIREQAGAVVVEDVPCEVFPATGTRSESGGVHHDHRGQCAIEYAQYVDPPRNRQLVVDGRRYRIVGAAPMPDAIPHVVLELVSSRGG